MIIHFTTVHPRTDTRIYLKQVATLAEAFPGRVELYVQDGLGNETNSATGVRTVDTGIRPSGRIKRMLFGSWRMYKALRRAQPTIAHFHDPELILVGLLLKLSGTKVVYDVHEDVAGQISSKPYLPRILRRPLAFLVRTAELIATFAFDGIVVATPPIAKKFSTQKCIVVHNFPIRDELTAIAPIPYSDRPKHLAYVGGISVIRCAHEMVDAFSSLPDQDIRLKLAGEFQPKALQEEIEKIQGWKKTDFLGWAKREQVAQTLGNVRAGFIILHPVRNYIHSFPVKMFEYMATGLPVIASDFPYWRKMLEGIDCALFVNPYDVQAISESVIWILENSEKAEAMGRRGQEAVQSKFNWDAEAIKLVSFYKTHLGA